MNNHRIFFGALTLLAVSMACAAPGLSGASTSAPAPVIEFGRAETMVAETVSAAIAQTEQAQPTSLPASTATNASTSAPAASVTPITTTTPETISADVNNNSTLTTQADGSTLFADQRVGYSISIPKDWLAMRINEQEYIEVLAIAETADPNIQQVLLGVKNEDPNVFRLLVMDNQEGHFQNEFVTDVNFIWDEKKNISFDSVEDLQAIANAVPLNATVFRFEVVTVQIVTTANGIKIGVIEAKSSFTNASGVEVPIYQKQVFFKGKTGTQSVIFTTIDGLKNTTLPTFNAMIETIKIIAK